MQVKTVEHRKHRGSLKAYFQNNWQLYLMLLVQVVWLASLLGLAR